MISSCMSMLYMSRRSSKILSPYNCTIIDAFHHICRLIFLILSEASTLIVAHVLLSCCRSLKKEWALTLFCPLNMMMLDVLLFFRFHHY